MSALDEAIEQAAILCKHFEGFSAKPYICPAGYVVTGIVFYDGSLEDPDCADRGGIICTQLSLAGVPASES